MHPKDKYRRLLLLPPFCVYIYINVYTHLCIDIHTYTCMCFLVIPTSSNNGETLSVFPPFPMSSMVRSPHSIHYLHVYFCAVDLLSNCLDDSNDDVLQPLPLRVVVQNEPFALLRVRAPKGRRAHAWVDGSQVVVQGIEVLQRGESGEWRVHTVSGLQ